MRSRGRGYDVSEPVTTVRLAPAPSIAHLHDKSAAPGVQISGNNSMSGEEASNQFRFELLSADSATWARRGRMTANRGVVETPAFMPVGTQATVKTLHPMEVAETGAQIIL